MIATFFDEPNARRNDPKTSHEAAALAKFKASPHRLACLNALMRGPMTDFELAAVTGLQQTSIGKRRLECQRAGLVLPFGWHVTDQKYITRKTPSGANAVVWRITQAGVEYLKGFA